MFLYQIDDSLSLILLQPRHAQELFNLSQSNKELLKRWTTWIEDAPTLEDTHKVITQSLTRFAHTGEVFCGIMYNGGLVGRLNMYDIDLQTKRTGFAYWLAEKYQGQGLMTKSCQKLLQYAFGNLGLNKVEIFCSPDNIKSQAVAKRLGFQQEGVLRAVRKINNTLADRIVFGLLADEWQKQGHL